MSDVELIMWVCFTVMFNPLKTEIYLIIFKNSVVTSQKTLLSVNAV